MLGQRVKAHGARPAPDQRRSSRWSARSGARTDDLDEPDARCRLVMGRSAAAWAALPRCSTKLMSSATTVVMGCPPLVGARSRQCGEALVHLGDHRPRLALRGPARHRERVFEIHHLPVLRIAPANSAPASRRRAGASSPAWRPRYDVCGCGSADTRDKRGMKRSESARRRTSYRRDLPFFSREGGI